MEYSDSVELRKELIEELIGDARATQMSCDATIVMFDPVEDKQLYEKLQFQNPNAHCFVIAQIGADTTIKLRSERLKNPFLNETFEKIKCLQPELGFCIFYNKPTVFSHWVWTIKIFVFKLDPSKNFATVFS